MEFTGSEKQIAWAQDIYSGVYVFLIKTAERHEANGIFKGWCKAAREIYAEFEAQAGTRPEAKWWIENRNRFDTRKLDMLVTARARQEYGSEF